jgi:hypothetical protein
MTNNARAAAIACSVQPDDLADRQVRWLALLDRAAVETARTERVLRLTLRADPGVADELESLATLDRDCCAVAHWSVYPGSTQVVLDVSGVSRETIAAAHGMFAGFERRLRQARTYLITFGNVPGHVS